MTGGEAFDSLIGGLPIEGDPGLVAALFGQFLAHIRWPLVLLAGVGAVLLARSWLTSAQAVKMADRGSAGAMLAGSGVLVALKLVFLPPGQFVLIDEWQNLGCVSELARVGVYAYPLISIAGLPVLRDPLEYAPLFHVLASVLVSAGASPGAAGAGVNLVATTLLLPAGAVLARQLRPALSGGEALTLGGLYASLPVFSSLARTSSTDPLFALLLTLGAVSLVSLVRDPARGPRHLLAVLAAILLAVYTRQEGWVLVAGYGVSALAAVWYLLGRRPRCNDLPALGLSTRVVAVGLTAMVVLALPEFFHSWVANVLGKGPAPLLERAYWALAAGNINILTMFMTPLALPVWLGIGALVAVARARPERRVDRALLLGLVLAYAASCVVYTQDQLVWADQGDVTRGPIFPRRTYHLGPACLMLFIGLVRFAPSGWLAATAPARRRLLAGALTLNVLGTVAEVGEYLHEGKVQETPVLARALESIEANAVVFDDMPVRVGLLSGHDYADVRLMDRLRSPEMARALQGRPLYAFDNHRSRRNLDEAVREHGITLTPTMHEGLLRVIVTPGPAVSAEK